MTEVAGQSVLENVREISQRFSSERPSRLTRRHLVKSDFDDLQRAGFLNQSLPEQEGGLWSDRAKSLRPLCELLRIIAQGDLSVALVASMHPAVVMNWTAINEAPEPHHAAFRGQRDFVLSSVREGCWWGTITSEPGTGGDLLKTRAVAKPIEGNDRYRMTGDKHFGSGSGICSFMATTAIPEGESAPDLFYLDMRSVPWDGTSGVKLVAEWDAYGMIATQSHAFHFEDVTAHRFGWPANVHRAAATVGPVGTCSFAAVILGVVETAMKEARQKLEPRRNELRPYDEVEWVQAKQEAWLIQQAYEGMLSASETAANPMPAALYGKLAISQLAESVTSRLTRIIGGGSLSRQSPFGQWAQDVRALGFLRPPWPLLFERLGMLAWAED